MTFKEHTFKKLQLIEEKVYSYNIPKDKELMMYDFYLMTYVDSLIKEGKTEPGPKLNAFGETETTPTLAMGVKPSTMESFNHIKTQIVDYLKPELLESAFYSIACEFRHCWDNNDAKKIAEVFPNEIDQQIFEYYIYYFSSLNAQLNMANNDAKETLKKRKEKYKKESGEEKVNSEEYFHSYMAAKKVCKKLNISPYKFVEVAAKAFNKFHGRSSDHREEDQEEYNKQVEQWDVYMKKYEQAKKEWESGKDLHHMTYKREMQLFKRYGIQPTKEKPVINQFPDPPDKPTPSERSTKQLAWSGNYGGRPWHNIAVAYLKLFNAKSEFEKILYIDNIYHQQHNTGTVFNKLQKYYKSTNSYGWILDALNFKANAKNNWERIKKTMELLEGKRRGFDNMMIEILKASGDKSWEQYIGIIPKRKSPKQELYNFRDWIALKNHPDHQDFITTNKEPVVYVGTGTVVPLLSEKLGVKYKELYSTSGSGIVVDKGYKGDVAHKDYYITAKKWNEIFGDLEKQTKKTEEVTPDAQTSANSNIIEKYKQYASETETKFPTEYKQGLVWMGKGIPDIGIRDELKKEGISFDDDTLYHLPETPNAHININLSPMNAGAIAYWNYFLKKDVWEKAFNDKVSNATATPESTNIIDKFKKYAEEGKALFSTEYNKGFIWIGKGVNKNGTLLSQLKNIDSNIQLNDIYNSGNINNNSEANNIGSFYHWDYFLKKDKWDELFGPLPTQTNSKNDDKTNHQGKKWVDIAKEKPVLFALGNYYVYIGTGNRRPSLITQLFNDRSNSNSILFISSSNNFVTNNFGNNPNREYYLLQSEWEKKFGPVPSTTNADNLDKEKFINLAKEGIKKYPNLFAQNYIYVGLGDIKNPLVDQLNISAEDLKSSGTEQDVDNTDYFSNSNTGTSSEWKYYLTKEKWEELFGPISALISPQQPTAENDQDNNQKEKFVKLAREGKKKFPKLFGDGLIYVGTGDPNAQLVDVLQIKSNQLKSTGIAKEVDDYDTFAHTNGGSDPAWHYYISKDLWESKFGPLDASNTSDIPDNQIDPKEMFTQLAKEGKTKFAKLFEQDFIYVGPGTKSPALSCVLGVDSGDLYSAGYATGDTASYGKNVLIQHNAGNSLDYHYFVKKNVWEKLFGPLEDAFDSSNNSTNETKEKYIKLAKYGETEYPKLHAKNYVYVGTGNHDTPLKISLGINSADLYSVDMDNKAHASIVPIDLSSGNSGSLPDWHYFTTKEVWDKLFGSNDSNNTNTTKDIISEADLLPHNILSKNGKHYYFDNTKPSIITQKTIVSQDLRRKVKNFADKDDLNKFLATFDNISSWNYSIDMAKSPIFLQHFAPKLKGKFVDFANLITYIKSFPLNNTSL